MSLQGYYAIVIRGIGTNLKSPASSKNMYIICSRLIINFIVGHTYKLLTLYFNKFLPEMSLI